jgi:hypothetical protein
MNKVVGHISSLVSHATETSFIGKIVAYSFIILLATFAAVLSITLVGIIGASNAQEAPLFLITSGLLFLIFIERVFL